VGRGASRRASGGPPRLARLAPALPLALLWPLNASDAVQASVLHREPEMFDYDRYTDADGYGRMGEWVRAHTPAGSVVAAGDTYLFHFWSRPLTVWLPAAEPGSDADLAAAATHVATRPVSLAEAAFAHTP
jgi:hypothetical protein